MRLEPVTAGNLDAVLAVSVRDDQADLVAPVVKSLAEAYVYTDIAWPRAICDGDRVVGFVMAFMDYRWGGQDLRSGLWRLNIDAEVQSKGYGRFAVEAVSDEIRSRGGTKIHVTYEPREGGPETFYRKLGFRPTGEQSEGQTVAVRDL